MKERCKKNIVMQVKSIIALEQNQPYSKQTVLVLDSTTSKILSRILSVEQLLDCGVTELLSLNKKKKPMPSAVSIYYVIPQSLSNLYQDFSSIDLYFSINILLSEQATEQMMKGLSNQERVMARLASFGELQIPWLFINRNIACLEADGPQSTEISPQQKRKKEKPVEVEMSHRQLMQIPTQNSSSLISSIFKNDQASAESFASKLFCGIVGSYYIDPMQTKIKVMTADTPFSRLVCSELKRQLVNYLKDWPEVERDRGCVHSEVVIVVADRQLDMLSPLVRSFYYRPLLMDLFDITKKSDEIEIVSPKVAPTSIKTDNAVWVKYQNLHIYEVFKNIDQDFKRFIETSEVAKFQKQEGESSPNNTKMKAVLKQFPEYTKTIKSYEANIQILNAIAAIKKEQNLDASGELEQTIISGVNGRREPEKAKKVLQKILSQAAEPGCSQIQKCRTLVLGACCLDLSSDETSKLMKELRKIPKYGDVALNLSKICNQGTRKFTLSPALHKNKELYLDRHNCLLATAIEDYLQERKSKLLKQVVVNEPVRTKDSPQSKISKLQAKLKPKTAYIVTMCGGLGYNELTNVERIIEQYRGLSAKDDIQVGFFCDTLVNPSEYLSDLCCI